MSRRQRRPNWDEQEAFGRAKRWHYWRPGERKQIKRQYSRRDRRESRQEIRKEVGE